MLGLTPPGQQVLEEREGASSRRGDYLAAIGIDDCRRPVLCHRLGQDRAKALLIDRDESGSLRVAIRFGRSFDQSLVGDLARYGELAALLAPHASIIASRARLGR